MERNAEGVRCKYRGGFAWDSTDPPTSSLACCESKYYVWANGFLGYIVPEVCRDDNMGRFVLNLETLPDINETAVFCWA